jgi:hypothetical protein
MHPNLIASVTLIKFILTESVAIKLPIEMEPHSQFGWILVILLTSNVFTGKTCSYPAFNIRHIFPIQILKILQIITLLSGTLAQSFCPETWTKFEDYTCFKLVETLVSKEYAQGLCQTENQESTVVSIKSEAEQKFIKDFILSKSTENVWTSGQRIGSTDTFKWQDGTTLSSVGYANWATDSPHPSDTSRTCIQLNQITGLWEDVSCGGIKNYILCQKNLHWDANKLQDILLQVRNQLIGKKTTK